MGSQCSKQKTCEVREKLVSYKPIYDQNWPEKAQEENCKEYFRLIKQKLRRFYEENQNNQFNISLSLDKKDFNTIVTSKTISINPSQKFIYWKDYLVEYLEKQVNKGVIWAVDLLELIKAEIFLSENKWLSLFFWQEFEMRTKPKCLSYSNPSETTVKIKIENEKNNSDSFEYNITDHFGGSFVSINTDTLSANDPTHEYKLYRSKVKAYIGLFRDHIFDPDHPINIVAKFFVKIFSHVIIEKLKELYTMRNGNNPEYHKQSVIITDEITKQLQKFILKLQTSLRLMYSRTINYQCFIEEKDEFINLVTCLIFKEGKLYDHIYDLYQLSLYEEVKILEYQLHDLKGITPEDLGIQRKFCLNASTLLVQKQLLQANQQAAKDKIESEAGGNDKPMQAIDVRQLMKNIDKKITCGAIEETLADIVSPGSCSSMKLNIKEESSHDLDPLENSSDNTINQCQKLPVELEPKTEFKVISESHSLVNVKKKNNHNKAQELAYIIAQEPYAEAIKVLKHVKKYRVPFEKMMLIAMISSEITECVNIFWKDMENVIPPSSLNIDADELMTIFIYIIVKAQMGDLLIHSKLIKQFTTITTRSTMIGYYYTTLEASLIYILSIKDKKELLDRDKLKGSFLPDQKSFRMDLDDIAGCRSSKISNK